MQARMGNPALIVPDAMAAFGVLGKSLASGSVPPATRYLVHLRASQINGCSVCVFGHSHQLRKIGETDERLFSVAAWRDAPFFTDAERAALSLTEAMTRLADQADPVSDEIWNEAAKHYDEPELASLVLDIANINLWNRLNAATRQVGGVTWD